MLTVRVEAQKAERRELLQALLAWAQATRAETGAVSCQVFEDAEDAAVFCLIGQWENQQAFETHLRGFRFGAMLGALELLALPLQLVLQAAQPGGEDPPFTLRRLRDGRRTGMADLPREEER